MRAHFCLEILTLLFTLQLCVCFASGRQLAPVHGDLLHARTKVQHAKLASDFKLHSTSLLVASNAKNIFANALGYVLGAGAITVYAPILIKVIKKEDVQGFSVATWVFNVLGYAMAIAYPMKKGFPVSTYVEVLGAALQSVVILGLLCKYNKQEAQFFTGLAALVGSYYAFMKAPNLDPRLIGSVQVLASLIANYANIPQLLVTFRRKKASWSGITALMSVAGCSVRIFTTLQLTKDKLQIGGYILGLLTNGLLLAQVIMYRNAK